MRTTPTSPASFPRRQGAGFFRWETADEPVAVHFHLNTLELLERDAIRVGKTTMAGILLGTRDESHQPALVIENYEPVPTAIWKSTDSPFGDRRQLTAMIERWRTKPNRRMEVLGFYRSAAPGEITPSQDDLSVLSAHPHQTESIFLMIEPRTGQPSIGRLFMANESGVKWEWSPRPFNRAELSGRGTPLRTEVRHSTTKKPSPPIPQESQEVDIPVEGERPDQQKWPWTIGALGIAVLLAVGIFHFRSSVTTEGPARQAELSKDSSLGLRFEREGSDLRLSWNSDSPALLRASEGRLLITDGNLRKTIDLDASDLRGGTIVYSPLTDDVVFRLEVGANDSPKPLSESVRIVGGLPTATLAPAIPSAGPAAVGDSQVVPQQSDHLRLSDEELQKIIKGIPPSTSVSSIRSNPISAGATKYEAGRQPSAKSAPLRPEPSGKLPEDTLTVSKVLPSPASRTKARPANSASRSAVVASPRGPAVASKAASPVSPTAVVKEPAESIPIIPAASSSVAFSSSLPRYVRRGGAVQPAQLLSNINPAYPVEAKLAGVSGSVELHFRISNTGDVHDIVVVKGPLVLAQAAVNAVRERRYKPARVDGVPTETDASAVFDFKLN